MRLFGVDPDEFKRAVAELSGVIDAQALELRSARRQARDSHLEVVALRSALREAEAERDRYRAKCEQLARRCRYLEDDGERRQQPEPAAMATADRRRLLRGQAALARSARSGISDAARRRALETAQELLGELPERHRRRLAELLRAN